MRNVVALFLLLCVGCGCDSDIKADTSILVQEWAFIDGVQVGRLYSKYDAKLGRYVSYGISNKDTLWVTQTSTLRMYKLEGKVDNSRLSIWQNTNTTSTRRR